MTVHLFIKTSSIYVLKTRLVILSPFICGSQGVERFVRKLIMTIYYDYLPLMTEDDQLALIGKIQSFKNSKFY